MANDWSEFNGKHVALFCSTDAIVPTWAYMFITIRLNGIAESVWQGSKEQGIQQHYKDILKAFDWSQYSDRIVVIKGCGSADVPVYAYGWAADNLVGVAEKIMIGEPCSSVPLWRKKSGGSKAAAGTAKATLPNATLPD